MVLSAMMMIKMSLVFRCTGPPSGTSRCCLSVVTVLSSSHRPWELPASLRPFPLLIRESIFLPLCCPFPERDAKKCAFPRQHAFHHGPVEKQTTATAAGGGAAVASLQHTAGSSRPQQPTAPHRCHYCQVSWNTNIKIVILSRKLPWLHAQECTDWVTYSGHFQWRALEESAMGEGGPENFPDFGFLKKKLRLTLAVAKRNPGIRVSFGYERGDTTNFNIYSSLEH